MYGGVKRDNKTGLIRVTLMRFVPASCMRPGMVLGSSMYGYDNELLLAAGTTINETEIKRIRLLKYQGIFIEDENTDEFEIKQSISAHLKNKAVKSLKNIFDKAEYGNDFDKKKSIEQAMEVTHEIVDQIVANKDATINLYDLKLFDDYTYYHSVNVAVLSVLMGCAMNFT